MNHLVVYPGGDDTSSCHYVDSLDEAVAFVESLRNSDGIEESKIYELNEIHYEVRPYYNVIVPGSTDTTSVAVEDEPVVVQEAARAEAANASVFDEVEEEVDQVEFEAGPPADEFAADAVVADAVETQAAPQPSFLAPPEAAVAGFGGLSPERSLADHIQVQASAERAPDNGVEAVEEVAVPTETVRRGLFGR